MSSLFAVKNVIICVLTSIVVYQYLTQPWKNAYVKRRKQAFTSKLASSINLESSEINDKLNDHTKLFDKKEIIHVNDQVYVGIGYGLANTILIEGDTSFIVVDTLESIDGATEFRSDFNKKFNNTETNKGKQPKGISTIIFTHYHADHTQGTTAFIDDVDNPPTIISHELTEDGLHRVNSIQSSIVYTRAMRQFGTFTKEYDEQKAKNESGGSSDAARLHVNSGIGPQLKVGDAWEKSILLPTKVVNEKFTRMTVDGVILDIYYAPGETDDQIFIYLPQSRTLLPADNIYETFPNLYAIRGSPTRDARKWVESLDTMRSLHLNQRNYKDVSAGGGAMYMVPCHTRPVVGADTIHELLTIYRDGIQYIHDQTLRFTNKGLTPSEMLPIIKDNMPARLRQHPWLQEFYGTIDWSIRGIFNAYLGWFSGDAADLFPLSKSKHAQNLIVTLETFANMFSKMDLPSGDPEAMSEVDGKIIDFMLDAATSRIESRMTRDDCQWSLDIATNLLHLRDDLELGAELTSKFKKDGNDGIFIKISDEQYERSRQVRISAMTCMAGYQISANGRNYYLTSALEDRGNFRIKPSRKVIGATMNDISMDYVFDSMSVRFKYETAVEHGGFVNFTTCFVFDITSDSKELASYLRAGRVGNGVNIMGNEDDAERIKFVEKKRKELDTMYSWYELEFRDGVVEVRKGGDLMRLEDTRFGWMLEKNVCMERGDLVVGMKSQVYKELAGLTGRSGAVLYAQGEINVVKGSVLTLNAMNGMFDRE